MARAHTNARNTATQFPQPRSLAQLEKGEWELKCPVCGRDMPPLRIREDKPYDGKTPYAISKFATERLVLNSGQQMEIPTVALRYSVTYGPRQSIFNPYTGVVSVFSTRILNNLPPVIYEDGQQTRDFTFVGDIVSANLFCMDNEACNWQPFNAGGGNRVTVEMLIQTLLKLYGREDLQPQLDGSMYRPGDARHMVPDPSRLEALGWTGAGFIGRGTASLHGMDRAAGASRGIFQRGAGTPEATARGAQP